MKFTFSVAVLLVVVFTEASANAEEKLDAARIGCNADPALKLDLEFKLFLGIASDEDIQAVGTHDLCVNVHLGIQSPNGDILIDNIRASLESENVDKCKIEEVLCACGTRKPGTTPERAAYDLAKCMYDEMNNHRE